MTRKTVTSLALAAGCAIALAVPAAQAQVDSQWSGNPTLNNRESRDYMRLLQTNRSFREARIRKECGPLTDPQLRRTASQVLTSTRRSWAARGWPETNGIRPIPLRGERRTTDQMTGSSTGMMGTTHDRVEC